MNKPNSACATCWGTGFDMLGRICKCGALANRMLENGQGFTKRIMDQEREIAQLQTELEAAKDRWSQENSDHGETIAAAKAELRQITLEYLVQKDAAYAYLAWGEKLRDALYRVMYYAHEYGSKDFQEAENAGHRVIATTPPAALADLKRDIKDAALEEIIREFGEEATDQAGHNIAAAIRAMKGE